jgi:hypothetical protein
MLSEAEVAALLAAYADVEAEAEEADREWWGVARRLVVVALGTALRRGELLGLRWQDVQLLERRLSVRQAFVRAEMTTPKSRTSRARSTSGPGSPRPSASSGRLALPLGTTRSCSAIRNSGRRSTRRRSRAGICGRRSSVRASPSRSGLGTISGTRRSLTTLPLATPRPTSRCAPATPRGRSRSATSTPPRCSSRGPRIVPKRLFGNVAGTAGTNSGTNRDAVPTPD